MSTKSYEILERRLVTAFATGAPPLSPTAAGGPPTTRLLSLAPTVDGGWRVEINSTDLTLNDKVVLERLIRDLARDCSISSGDPSAKITTYFRKTTGSRPVGAPVPSDKMKNGGAFGLKFSRRALPGVRSVIAVASGKGGVGKSTVSTNLAVSLAAAGQRVGFLDADIYGPSATLMFGVQGPVEVTADRRLTPKIGHGVAVMSMGLLYDANAPAMWRGPMVVKALEQLIYETDWGELDVLVVDLPPGTGDVQLTLIEKLPLAGAIIVTTPQDVALIDARKAFRMFQKLSVPLFGLVENMSTHRCGACGHEEAIFGAGGVDAFVKESGSRILARLPLAADIRFGGDRGEPVALGSGPHALAFQELAAAVEMRLGAVSPR